MARKVSRVEAGFAVCKSAKQLTFNGRYPADGSRAVPGKSIGAFVQAADARYQRLIEDSSICYFQVLCAPTSRMGNFKDRQASVFCMLSGPATACKICMCPECNAGSGRTVS
jgi:hypothetical protein